MKKLTKKQQETLIKIRENELSHKKQIYNSLLKVLAKYDIKHTALVAIRSEENFNDRLTKKIKWSVKNNKSFMEGLFGTPNPNETELEKKLRLINANIKHRDHLIAHAENRISMLDHDTKMKIADDSISFGYHSLRLLVDSFDKKEKEAKKKPVKKKTASKRSKSRSS